MKTSVIVRFVLLATAWLATVGLLLARTPRITPYTIFVIVASAIIIFVPMYKKYVRDKNHNKY